MSDSTFCIESSTHDGITTVRIKGWAGMAEQASLDLEFTRLSAVAHRVLILDLSELTGMASLAVGQIVLLQRAVTRRGGRLAIARPSAEVRALFVRCKLDTVVPMFETELDALAPPSAGTNGAIASPAPPPTH